MTTKLHTRDFPGGGRVMLNLDADSTLRVVVRDGDNVYSVGPFDTGAAAMDAFRYPGRYLPELCGCLRCKPREDEWEPVEDLDEATAEAVA